MAVGLGTLTLNLIAQTGLFTQGLNRAEQQTRNSARNMSNELNLVGRSFKDLQGTLMASFAGALTIGAAISKMDAYTGLQNRLKLVTTSQTELNQAMKDTFSIAQATGQSWDSTAQVYQRFADNAQRLGITLQQTASLTDTVAKSISISGGSAASAEAALVQFGQALASGVLRGEEFNSISEQAPALLKAIASGLGTNIGELRKMAAEGQLTADVVIKSLEKAKVSVDDLFSKTDFTIGNSFTMLNNAAIQFVGEAGKSSGAAQILSSSIKGLADNLQLIADIAIIGGVALLTKALLSQTLVIKEAVIASVARRAAQAAEAESEIRLAALEVARSRRQAALAAQEVHLARLAYNDALTKNQRAAATVRLTQAEIAHRIALHQSTAALAANAAAQDALNVSRAAGARLLALVGGPIGAITLGVTALAAGYMYLQGRTAAANQKLEEQMEIAKKTKEELIALKGVQRDVAINDLQEAFDKQNIALRNLNNEFLGFIDNIGRTSTQSNQVYEIFEQARTGALSNADALERLNKLNLLTPEQKKQGLDLVNNYILQAQKSIDAEKALKIFGITVKMTGNDAQNAAVQQLKHADALDASAIAADKANDALTKYRDKLKENAITGLYKQGLLEQGYSPSQAGAIFDLQQARGMSAILSKEEVESALNVLRITEQTTKAEQAYNDRIKQGNDALKKRESERKKASDEADRLSKQQYQDREDIYYKYASREMKIEKDLQGELKKIREAGFTDQKMKAGYIANAENRANLEKELYVALLSAELNEWQDTEQEKLSRQLRINELRINLDADMNDEFKQQALDSLVDRLNQESAWLKLEKEQRLFDARQFYMSESEILQERYRLERLELEKINDLNERNSLLAIKYAEEEFEKRKNLKDASMAWGQSYADMTGTGAIFQLNQDRFSQYDQSNALFDSQIALAETAEQREAIWQAHNDRMRMIDENYWNGTKAYQLGMAADVFGGLSGAMLNFVEESSSSYQALVAIQKGANLASVLMNSVTAISAAWASAPFPYNLPAVAMATVETGALQATLQAFTPNISGMAHNGIDNIPKEGTWLLDGGERVLNPEQNKDLTSYLNDRQAANSQSASPSELLQTVQINNILDPAIVGDYLAMPAGTKQIMNTIKRNATTINTILGRR